MIDFETEQEQVQVLKIELESVSASLAQEEKELARAEKDLEHKQAAQEILQHLAMAVQQQAHKRLAEVVSSCLQSVFDDPYSFHIEFERKRGKTEASLRFRRRGLDVDPITASGGGMIDVAAFALRVACLVLHRPKLNRVVVIDEGFKFVSAQYRENVRSMLEQLSEDLGVQIIQVTHIEELETGKIIEL